MTAVLEMAIGLAAQLPSVVVVVVLLGTILLVAAAAQAIDGVRARRTAWVCYALSVPLLIAFAIISLGQIGSLLAVNGDDSAQVVDASDVSGALVAALQPATVGRRDSDFGFIFRKVGSSVTVLPVAPPLEHQLFLPLVTD